MGKAIDKTEFVKARAQLEGCKDRNCPNAGADGDKETTTYCKPCKVAKKVTRDYDRAKG